MASVSAMWGAVAPNPAAATCSGTFIDTRVTENRRIPYTLNEMTFIDTHLCELNITQQNIIDGHFAGGMLKSLSMSTMNHGSLKLMNKAIIIIVKCIEDALR